MDSSSYALAFAARADEALAVMGAADVWIDAAGLVLKIRFAGSHLAVPMSAAFDHVRIQSCGIADLEITVWDSESSGVPLPAEVGPIEEHLRRGMAQLQRGDSILSLFEAEGGLSMLDFSGGRGVYWVSDAIRLSERNRAAPLQTILNWWLPSQGRAVVHAGAIGLAGEALLLYGKSGAGKSTTAIACAEAGFTYLADDFTVLTMDGAVTAHSLYCSGKVFQHNLNRLPRFEASVAHAARSTTEKAIAYLDSWTEGQATSMPVKGAVALTAKGFSEPSLKRITPGRGLLALAPSTLFNLPGQGQSQLARLAALASRVPCYEMHLASDLAANAAALRSLLMNAG